MSGPAIIDDLGRTGLAQPARVGRSDTVPTKPVPAIATGRFQVEVLEDPSRVNPDDPDWRELVEEAIEANSFLEPWFVASAARWFAHEHPWRLVRVWREPAAPHESRTLCGVIALELANRFGSWRVPHLRTWRHRYGFLGAPLVRRSHERDFWRELFAWADGCSGARFLELRLLPGEGPLHRALVEELRVSSRLAHTVDEHTRALLETATDSESYLERALSKNHRRELRRRYRRFQEAGRLTLRELTDATQLDHWIGEFLRLEASGWKGAESGALALDRSRGEFFSEMATRAFLAERLELFGFFVDDRPVALKCNLRAGNGGFAFKIAYDEEFAKYSPGVQLEVANIDRLHDAEPDGATPASWRAPTRWMDSCAIPDHPMINRLWSERRVVRRLAISTHNRLGDLALAALPLRKIVSGWFRKQPSAGNVADH
jgi:CelD/BcsL family acetyltransferase involved in cellulose biosynthesis